jgi:hypothetical protein
MSADRYAAAPGAVILAAAPGAVILRLPAGSYSPDEARAIAAHLVTLADIADGPLMALMRNAPQPVVVPAAKRGRRKGAPADG